MADLCLNFVATGSDGEEIPLLPGGNGKEVSVTAENRVRYIYLCHGCDAGPCSSCAPHSSLVARQAQRLQAESRATECIHGLLEWLSATDRRAMAADVQ